MALVIRDSDSAAARATSPAPGAIGPPLAAVADDDCVDDCWIVDLSLIISLDSSVFEESDLTFIPGLL